MNVFSRLVTCNSFATPWTVARQALLSRGFSRQEYWSRLPFPTSGDLPDPGIKSVSPVWAGGFFTIELQGTALELPSSGLPCNSLDSAPPVSRLYLPVEVGVGWSSPAIVSSTFPRLEGKRS